MVHADDHGKRALLRTSPHPWQAMDFLLRSPFLFLILFALAAIPATPARAQGRADLGEVKPVESCAALAGASLDDVAGAPVTLSATLVDTAKGQFCQVTGTIAPAIGFEVDLPTANWTQRFLEAGCGGLCGMVHASIGNANSCAPALDGQFVVAASDLGHKGRMGDPNEGAFAKDPQKRIDFAYRANHLTALVAKGLIQAFYGQPARYSYFSGCSDGGREALIEAERYPLDFDGVSAGAPAMLFQVQNSFYHAWTAAANTRPDGSHILLADKLAVLHKAVIDHCDELDGTRDGLLADPRACAVDPAWVRCPAGAPDRSACLTEEEWAVATKLYEGPTDAAGHHFLPGGLQPGSEMQWFAFVPREAHGRQMSAQMTAAMSTVVLEDASDADADAVHYPFTAAQFARVTRLHGLNDATDTDLRRFSARGGKLIMWHGWSDSSIAPMISIAYYKAVQRDLGEIDTDRFLRLFMIPGVGHCGGGDGFGQVDTLSALMNWVENGSAPERLLAEKIAERRMGPPPGGPDGRAGVPGAGTNGADGRGGPPTGARSAAPFAQSGQPALASRPVYPFPRIARYDGEGDPAQAESYGPAASPVAETDLPDWYGADLIGLDFQRTYRVDKMTLAPVAQ